MLEQSARVYLGIARPTGMAISTSRGSYASEREVLLGVPVGILSTNLLLLSRNQPIRGIIPKRALVPPNSHRMDVSNTPKQNDCAVPAEPLSCKLI